MKRQRNIQQVKEHDKGPQNQTKEEEIGSLPEKELRVMIVKNIQNLENKMKLQIVWRQGLRRCKKSLTRTQKKQSQSIMNNAITEINNTLEGPNSRITEAEDTLSKVEDRMEINEAERKKEKNNEKK